MSVAEPLLHFTLPPALEAQEPPEVRGNGRDDVRLLVSDRATGDLTHARFPDIPGFLRPGDLVVVNDSGTLPAELTAVREDGSSFPLRLSTHMQTHLWVAEPREVEVTLDERLVLPDGGVASVLAPYTPSRRLWIVRLDLPEETLPYLLRNGRPIRYPYVPHPWPLETYQTVYHGELGSAEMPSAGRPFTTEILARLAAAGIEIARLTLHTGVASLENDEAPYDEFYRVPPETASAVNRIRASGGRVIAVGTTVVRALETAASTSGQIHPGSGWTDLMIGPKHGVHAVDGLLTGFHEPRSTHLLMLEALADRSTLIRAYQAALTEGYLWHEFGDMHLIA